MADSTVTFTAQAKELREGESLSRVVRIPIEKVKGRTISTKLAAMRNSMGQVSTRCREETERGYRVESGSFNTHDGSAVILVCVLTCMEDEGEDDI